MLRSVRAELLKKGSKAEVLLHGVERHTVHSRIHPVRESNNEWRGDCSKTLRGFAVQAPKNVPSKDAITPAELKEMRISAAL